MGRIRKNEFLKNGYTAGWYDYKTDDICLCFWKNNERIIESIPFKWYFFMSKKDVESISCPVFDHFIDDLRFSHDDGFYRVYSDVNWERRREFITWLRSREVEPLEADLPPLNRFLTDNPIKFDESPRLLFYDLETDARAGWGDIESHRILSIAYCGIDKKTYCMVAKTLNNQGERDLLLRFLKEVVSQHDVLVAWNGDVYDEKVIHARCKHNNIKTNWKMVNFLDFMALFKHQYFGYGRDTEGKGIKLSFGLDNIAKTLLGYGKGKIEGVQGHRMWEIWKNDKKLLRRYNKRDVDIMIELEKKFGYISSFTTLSHLCNRFVSSWSLMMGYLNDAFILRYGMQRGIHFSTKISYFSRGESQFKKKKQYEGAYVMKPKMGLHYGICDIDFASLYANVIRTFNISPETRIKLDEDNTKIEKVCEASNGALFKMDVEGAFPAIVSLAINKRKKYKEEAIRLEKQGKENTIAYRKAKQRSDAYKLLGNGSYGVLGSVYLRYYDIYCAEAVSLSAKAATLLIIDEAKKVGITTIYSDTDSLFLKCTEKQARKFCKRASIVLDEWIIKKGGNPGFLRLELDAVYERIFFVSKKHYAGCKTTGEKGKPDIKGLEYIRTVDCQYARNLQKAMIDYLLYESNIDSKQAKLMVLSWRDKLFSLNVSVDDLVLTQSIQKEKLSDYTNRPIHVRIAEKLLEDGREVYSGMKIPYIITGKEKSRQTGIHRDDFDGNYDPMIYWRDKVFPPTLRILESVFPKIDWDILCKQDPRKEKYAKKHKRTSRIVG